MLTINQASDTRHARSTRKSPFDQVVGSLTLGNRMLCWRSQVLRYDPWKRHFPSAGGWLHVETIKGEIESRTLSEAVATYGEEVGDLMTSRGAASELTKITQIENKAISPLYDSFKLDSLRQQNIAPMKEKKKRDRRRVRGAAIAYLHPRHLRAIPLSPRTFVGSMAGSLQS